MKFIIFSIVLGTGIIIGFITRGLYTPASPETEAVTSQQLISDEISSPFTGIAESQITDEHETEINSLRQQITKLEQELEAQQQDESADSEKSPQHTRLTETQIKQALIKIGITESMADEILNRQSQHEYQLLTLHDQAKREGYLNSSRYYKQRRELMQQAPSLQNAIGTDAYDRFLYQTEQNNRVVVSSVMQNSPADQLGVQNGDIILKYATEKILSWRELRELTGQGVAGEYVNLNILRNEQLLNILVPRGPLGVKLETTRLDPETEYNY
ncbi:MAG: PDZ domain-containing protein [Gammaproteobacteria bacterium]|nr:PDZ domain-containing protein [Gammaproteobacteria bacterium]MCW9005883.1 PDZ domain-containing protein [Gammaproteobacteria bacterium]